MTPDEVRAKTRTRSMTPDEVRTVIRRHIEHLNSHDEELIASGHTERSVVESPSTGTHHGRVEIAESYRVWNGAFPDLEFSGEDIIAEGNHAVVILRLAGTHRSTFLGLPATGKRIEFRCVSILRFEGEQIAHERRIYDFSGLLIKLGVLKVKPA